MAKRTVLLSIIGPTAVGKTVLAIDLARMFNTEIISADSRQVYKEMSIGTAKPTIEEQNGIKHHFIDHCSINERFTAADFSAQASSLIQKLSLEKKIIVLAGGSGLYCQALWYGMDDMPPIDLKLREQLNEKANNSIGYENLLVELANIDPEYFSIVDKKNKRRVIRAIEVFYTTGEKYSFMRKGVNSNLKNLGVDLLTIGLVREREELYQRINNRVIQMLENGWLEEANELVDFQNLPALQTVGYNELFRFLKGELDMKQTQLLIQQNTRRYAKRQLTWFRKYPEILWFHPEQTKEMNDLITNYLNTQDF